MSSEKNVGWDIVPDGKRTGGSKTGKGGFEKGKGDNNPDLYMKLPDGGHKIRLVGKSHFQYT